MNLVKYFRWPSKNLQENLSYILLYFSICFEICYIFMICFIFHWTMIIWLGTLIFLELWLLRYLKLILSYGCFKFIYSKVCVEQWFKNILISLSFEMVVYGLCIYMCNLYIFKPEQILNNVISASHLFTIYIYILLVFQYFNIYIFPCIILLQINI